MEAQNNKLFYNLKPKLDLWLRKCITRSDQLTHNCLRDFLSFGQIISVFQVENVRNMDPGSVRFKWFSPKMVYALVLLGTYTMCCLTGFYKAMQSEVTIYYLISPLFYAHVALTIVLFIRISKKWPDFIKKTCSVEAYFVERYKLQFSLRKRINITAAICYTIGMALQLVGSANLFVTRKCPNQFTGFEYYAKKQFHYIFHYVPYNSFAAVFLLVSSWIATLIWHFGDVFIILMCTSMATRYKQLTSKMVGYAHVTCPKGKFVSIYAGQMERVDKVFWKTIREDYDKLCRICRKMDDLLSDLVVAVYTSNLCFILIQLFISLRDRDSILETIYFFFSFGFVIARTISTSIFGGWLHEESRSPLLVLNSVPTEIYNEEISRLIWQIHITPPALTGHNFFKITKGLVLSVAAAIITYELVLIQFNQATLDLMANGTLNKTICL